MKKSVCLNSGVSHVIADMGHFEQLTIGDAGLPVPKNVEKIDLAVTFGTPRFLEVVDVILSELKIQKAIIASEMKIYNVAMYENLKERLIHEGAEIMEIPHEEFKKLTSESRAVVRTGECTAYSNVILESNVSF